MATNDRRPMGDRERARMDRPHLFAVNGSADFLNLVRELFEGEAYNITTTNYVPETFDQIAALRPSVLLVDLIRHERAGWDLLERLQTGARTHGIPVLVLSTAKANLDGVRDDHARYGGDAFLHKPFDLDDLLRAVQDLLAPATRH